MSDTVLKLIPRDPKFVPQEKTQVEAADVLREYFPNAETIENKTLNKVEFVDPGVNLEKISCPKCGKMIDIPWWKNVMDEKFDKEKGFSNLEIQLPCCGNSSSLNELVYSWSAGFSSYILEVRNPGGDLDGDILKKVESLMGCGLKEILAHY